MATHTNPIQTTNSIAFTVDTLAAAFAVAAFTLIGAGMLALASAAARAQHRGWVGYTTLVALALFVTAGSYAASNDDVSDLMLFIIGLVLLPAWLIWAGRSSRVAHGARTQSTDLAG